MPFTLVAFSESQDTGPNFAAVAAVPDPHVFVSGDDIRLPDAMRFIAGYAALINDLTVVPQARLTSPSLRSVFNQDIGPITNGAVFSTDPNIVMHPLNPLPLIGAEALNFEVIADPAAGTPLSSALVWLSDGPLAPATGEIHTIRATAAHAGLALGWGNGALTFAQTLPVGRYQVVGMRYNNNAVGATTALAARLVFPGGIWRPGTYASNLHATYDAHAGIFRHGRLGVWGEFHTNAPPTLDVFGSTIATHQVLLDLIRVG